MISCVGKTTPVCGLSALLSPTNNNHTKGVYYRHKYIININNILVLINVTFSFFRKFNEYEVKNYCTIIGLNYNSLKLRLAEVTTKRKNLPRFTNLVRPKVWHNIGSWSKILGYQYRGKFCTILASILVSRFGK